MKLSKILCLILGVLLAFGTVQMAAADNNTADDGDKLQGAIVLSVGSNHALLDGAKTQIDVNTAVTPVVDNGTTFVPVRFVAGTLKAGVKWDGASNRADISLGGVNLSFTVGSLDYTVNKQSKALLAAPKNIGGRVLVPLRAIAEAFGKQVFYDRGLIILSNIENIYDPVKDKGILDNIVMDKLGALPSIDSFENLAGMMKEYGGRDRDYGIAYATGAVRENASSASGGTAGGAPVPGAAPTADASKQAESGKGSDDYSTTNVQVQGVDEADVIKTDGEYIYKIDNNALSIAKVMPAEAMEISKTINFTGNTYSPYEMYVDGNKLVVLGNFYEEIANGNMPMPAGGAKMAADIAIMPGYRPSKSFTRVDIYNIDDKHNPYKLRTVDIEGNYSTSRKIGSSVYLVSNTYFYGTYDEEGNLLPQDIQPMYRDTAAGEALQCIDYANIKYFPGGCMPSSNYMNVAGIDIDSPDQQAHISSYLGGSHNVYASAENMYVVADYAEKNGEEKYDYVDIDENGNKVVVEKTYPTYKYGTKAYKFALSGGRLTYQASAVVEGNILNQFSMDEHEGNFRIATTVWDYSKGEAKEYNNLYIFNEDMEPLGNITNIAPGERIYSVRFMGDKAYMVTFKQVDPLFVIDVADPSNPQILGQLKIPGYSDYLHPYDETHIIGFGKDADEEGRAGGMKMAIFDVSDFANPREMHTEYIGDRGTSSELLYNHKALLFSKEKNLLAFPVSLYEIPDSYKNTKGAYGVFKYQGLYVYDISLENGFNLRGRISHITDAEYAKFGNDLSYSVASVLRGLYIGDNLYTISNYGIQAHDLNTLQYKGTVIYR